LPGRDPASSDVAMLAKSGPPSPEVAMLQLDQLVGRDKDRD